MDLHMVLLGLVIFIARVCDVSIGTVRTIVTVHGRSGVAFFLGLVEISLWLAAASTVIVQVKDAPILGAFYVLGYATGNYLGIQMERKIAFGSLILRVITAVRGKEMADALREKGQAVTVFTGEGFRGTVKELYIVCRRRDLRWILPLVKAQDPEAFYITERAGSVSKVLRPVALPATGWRAIFKKK